MTKLLRGVRRLGSRRRRLVRSHRLTRRTRLGRSFLGGVDRRVHAPLGTVINFSSVLTGRPRFSSRRQRRFISVVGAGAGLLLGLINSILRLSHVRSNGLSFVFRQRDIHRLLSSICRARDLLVRPPLRFLGSFPPRSIRIGMSPVQLARMLAGFLGGTGGFAGRNDVRLKCYYPSNVDRMRLCIRSANVNVPRDRRGVVFRHFCGHDRFSRNIKLNLSVYILVIRGVKKHVRLHSRRTHKDHFAIILPYVRWVLGGVWSCYGILVCGFTCLYRYFGGCGILKAGLGSVVLGEMEVTLATLLLLTTMNMGTRIAATSVTNGIASTDGRPVVNTAMRTIRRPSNSHCKAIAGISKHCSVRNVHANNPCQIRVSCVNCRAIVCGSVALRLNRMCGLGMRVDRSSRLLGRIVIATTGAGFATRGANTAAGVSSTRVARLPAIGHDVDSVTHLSPCTGNVDFTNNSKHSAGFAVSNTGFGGGFKLDSGLPNNNGPVSVSTVRRIRMIITPFSIHRAGFVNNNVGTVAGDNAGAFENATCACCHGRSVHNGHVGNRSLKTHSSRSGAACNFALNNPVVGGGLFFFMGCRGRGAPKRIVGCHTHRSNRRTGNVISHALGSSVRGICGRLGSGCNCSTNSCADFPTSRRGAGVLTHVS